MNSENKDEVVQLYLDDIIPNRFQPREVFDEKALKELAVSIKEHGVIQPIIVRSVANGKYEIIAGERRYKASALAGQTKIPAIVRNLDDKESSKVALLENLQRRNLNPIEEARTYQKILEIDEMTQEELAKTMGKSQSAVANKLRLLSLPIEIQESLLQEKISERHARTLLTITDPKKQQDLLKKIINNKMTVRELEEEIKAVNKGGNGMNNDIDINSFGKSPDSPVNEVKKPQYINYGEIKDDDDDDIDNNYLNPSANNINNIDVDKIKNQAIDINNNIEQKSQSALDSLLNISEPINDTISNVNTKSKQAPSQKEFKFITPAEEIVKKDEIYKPDIEDYFKTPDIIPTNTNTTTYQSHADNTTVIKDRQSAIESIRKTISNIKNSNIKIEMEEMDFDKSYQIIIKIEK